MARCNACQVTITDDTTVCPLCGGSLVPDGKEPHPPLYPDLVLKERVMVMVTRMFLVFGALLELFLVMINLTVDPKHLWCVITGASLLYVVLVLYTVSVPQMALRSRFLILSLGLILIGVSVDWMIGFRGWVVSVGLPIQILFMDITILVLYLIQKRDFQQYIWMCFLNLFFCMIVLIGFFMGYRIFFGWMFVAFAVTILELLMIMVRGGKRTPAELKRRFHA